MPLGIRIQDHLAGAITRPCAYGMLPNRQWSLLPPNFNHDPIILN